MVRGVGGGGLGVGGELQNCMGRGRSSFTPAKVGGGVGEGGGHNTCWVSFNTGAGGAGAPTHWQWAATLHCRGFPHSLPDYQGAQSLSLS